MTNNKKLVSLVIPCYNEEASLPALYDALEELMAENSNYNWEILLINDGSSDHTIDLIHQLHQQDSKFCYIDLTRNFGKENALLAGFDYTSGDCTIIMDADLQHPVSVIPQMLAKWEEGYDDVYGKRLSRGKESWLRKQSSLIFYKLLQKSARCDILPNVGDFRLLDRKCIVELRKFRESERYTKGMYAWIGFNKTYVEFETQDRVAGESHMNYRSLMHLAVDGITSFSVAPLKWAAYLGIIVSIMAFVFMVYTLIHTWIYGDPVAGYPTLMTTILFLSGVQLIALGVMGEYLGKIFIESKKRPVYLVKEAFTLKHTNAEQNL